jgi:hypothetical protein
MMRSRLGQENFPRQQAAKKRPDRKSVIPVSASAGRNRQIASAPRLEINKPLRSTIPEMTGLVRTGLGLSERLFKKGDKRHDNHRLGILGTQIQLASYRSDVDSFYDQHLADGT